MYTSASGADLIANCIRVRRGTTWDRVFVIAVNWHGPHSPHAAWRCAHARPARLARSQEDLIRAALANRKYFRVCEECGALNLRGWMHDAHICMACAENHHGVVH